LLFSCLLFIGAFFLLIPNLEEFKKYVSSKDQPKEDFNVQKRLKEEEKEESEALEKDLGKSTPSQSENMVNAIIGALFLILGFILFFRVSDSYFKYAPQDLGSSVLLKPFNFQFPVFTVIFIGIFLLIVSLFPLNEALNEFRDLEETQLAYYLKKDLSTSKPKKILFMGLARSGKTTVLEWLLGKQSDTLGSLHATIDHEIRTMTIGNTEVTILDTGGKTTLLDKFIGELAKEIFSGVTTLVFVVDSIELKDITGAKYYFEAILKNLRQHSPGASVFIFQHKLDLIPRDLRIEIRETIIDYLLKDIDSTYLQEKVRYCETSIFLETMVEAMQAVFNVTLGYTISKELLPHQWAKD
jgi:GTPase SAR1 family protein